ncbi:proton channel OTOP2 [Engraulis encrasicolus]|uniref:proton channel OTOP2 n=1 Tax=Engraulis encrasicolus TaxID=184585 RepID=UPI002FD3403D
MTTTGQDDKEEPRVVFSCASSPPIFTPSHSTRWLGPYTRRLSSWTSSPPAPACQDPACTWSSLLSGLLALNIFLLGCALVCGSVFNKVNITSAHLQLYLITLMLLSTCWMLYYTAYTSREDHAVLYKDGHAGPIWLRGGLILFGLCSMIMDIFKLAYFVGYMHCDSAIKIVFPIVQAVFILVQTYFLWLHAKDCVQLQRNFTRCGLMLTLSTNLMLWMTAVTEESLHQTVIPSSNSSKAVRGMAMRVGANENCVCSHSACSIFEMASNYLYPFNIEYSLFASAMTYVMWKNVGRLLDEHHHPPHQNFHPRDVLLGPVNGFLVLLAGLVTFIMYKVEVQEQDVKKREAALQMHYIMDLVTYILMSGYTLAGWVLYGLDQREHVSGKNPTRSLDVGLLLGASMGPFSICYFTMVAVVATGAQSHLDGLNLSNALMAVVQLLLQNGFIIEGLHRQPYSAPQSNVSLHSTQVLTNMHAMRSHSDSELMETMTVVTPTPSAIHSTHPPRAQYAPPTSPSTMSAPVQTYTSVHHHHHSAQPLSWKRRALKEICAFLILCNITLWIKPAFGARPQFENPHGHEFYQVYLWVAVVNIGLPFSIFYRMHSVAGLFELYFIS